MELGKSVPLILALPVLPVCVWATPQTPDIVIILTKPQVYIQQAQDCVISKTPHKLVVLLAILMEILEVGSILILEDFVAMVVEVV
jgi:hypothetical protein